MIVYEDAALAVVNKPAGLSSETGLPDALRALWGKPDAYVGVVHRLDIGVSGLMVLAKTPNAAAALTRQITESQDAYAVLDGRAEPTKHTPAAPVFVKQYRAVLAGAPDESLPEAGTLRDYLFKDSRKGRVFPVSRPRKGVREAVLEYRITATPSTPGGPIRSGCSSPPESIRSGVTANTAAGSRGTLPCKVRGCNSCTRKRGSRWNFGWKSRTRNHGTSGKCYGTTNIQGGCRNL